MSVYDRLIASLQPVAWWKLSDAVGATQAADSSGNNNPATVNGGVTFGQPGIPGSTGDTAALFNGTNGYCQASEAADLEFGSNSFSVVTWFSTTNASGQFMVGKKVSTSSHAQGWVLAQAGAGDELASMSDGTHAASVTSATSYDDGHLHCAVMVVNRTAQTLTAYVDNAVVGSTSITSVGSVSNSAQQVQLGAGVSAGEYFNGTMSEVSIFNFALTPAQVQTIFNTGKTALTGYLDFQGAINVAAGTTDMDSVQAANIWAGISQAQGYFDLLGALNTKAGISQQSGWLGLDLVLNVILLNEGIYNYQVAGKLDSVLAMNMLAGLVSGTPI